MVTSVDDPHTPDYLFLPIGDHYTESDEGFMINNVELGLGNVLGWL